MANSFDQFDEKKGGEGQPPASSAPPSPSPSVNPFDQFDSSGAFGSSPSWSHTAKFLAQETLRGGAELAGIPGDLGRLLRFPSAHPVDSYLPGISDVNRGFDWAEGKLGVSPLVAGTPGEGFAGAVARNVVPTGLALGTGGALGPTLAAGVAGPLASEAVRQAGGGPLPQIAAGALAGAATGGASAITRGVLASRAAKAALEAQKTDLESATRNLESLRLSFAQGKESNLQKVFDAEDLLAMRKDQSQQLLDIGKTTQADAKASLASREAAFSQRISEAQKTLKTTDIADPNYGKAFARLTALQNVQKGFLSQTGQARTDAGDALKVTQSQAGDLSNQASSLFTQTKRGVKLDEASLRSALVAAGNEVDQRRRAISSALIPTDPREKIMDLLAGEGLLAGPGMLAFMHMGFQQPEALALASSLGAAAGLTYHGLPHTLNPLVLGGAAQGAIPGLVAPGWKGGGGR